MQPGSRSLALTGTLVVVAVAVLQVAASALTAGPERSVVPQVLVWGLQMPLTMGVLHVLRRELDRRRVGVGPSIVLYVVAAGLVGAAFHLGLAHVAADHPLLRHRPERMPTLGRASVFGILLGQLHCGLWALAFVFPAVAEEARTRRLEAERLRAEAELLRLRAHLEPHFLLNALNAVSGLVGTDPREARRLIACIGDLLRDAVKVDGDRRPLGDELAWLERYAQVFEARYPGVVTFRWDIDERARGAWVPTMLLQPLVENAVRHGVLRKSGGGTVTVGARVTGDGAARHLECSVEDDGPGLEEESREGFGLRSVRRRIELLYPGSSLHVASSPQGTRWTASVPWLAEGEAG